MAGASTAPKSCAGSTSSSCRRANLSANELAAARVADQGAAFNPQQQFRVVWPAEPVVARAYLDQLGRDRQLDEPLAAEIAAALDEAQAGLDRGARDRRLAGRLNALAGQVRAEQADPLTSQRTTALGELLNALAERLENRQRS
jgi:hypothetical protein